MDNLSDVCSCLRALDSSRATDRKKNATRLQELLGTNSVKKVLDQNHDNVGQQRAITWDVILNGVNKYINIELSSLKTAKESQSATTLASRNKRKHELADIFKFVVRAANERGARLSASLLIDSILEILNDDFTLGALGADYSNILLKSVLRVRAYWLKLSPQQWRKLLHIYCKLFEEEAFDTDIVVRIIKELVDGNIQQGELNPKKVFSFFSRMMERISNLRAPSVLENLLMSLNKFCASVAPGCRAQLCGFGESQMKAFTNIWENASTEKIKIELIEFLHLLVKAHHPQGVSKSDKGAFAIDWSLWKSQLLILHELVVSDIDMSAASYKIISGSKESGLSADYIRMAADIFKQLPVTKIVPVSPDWSLTQATQLTGQVRESETPAKRQRLAPEKKSLLELIKENSGTLQAVPWLQILRKLLEQYPQVFDEEKLHLTMELLVNNLGRCKKGRLYQLLFAALSALISALHQHNLNSPRQSQLMASLWSHCLSTINSRQAGVEGYQEQGFSTMTTIINCGYVQPRPEIWNLFLPGLCRPCSAANSLLTALVCQRIPENHVPSIVGTSSSASITEGWSNSETRPTYPLRKCLIRWLVPFQAGTENLGEAFTVTDLDPREVAENLYALNLQNLSSIKKTNKHRRKIGPEICGQHSLESLYLDNLFETSAAFYNNPRTMAAPSLHGTVKNESFQHGPHIPTVIEYLRKYLHQVSRNLESSEPKVQTLECLSWFCCMLTKLFCLLVSSSGKNNPELNSEESSGSIWPGLSPLQKILCSVIEKCAALFVSYVNKENTTGLRVTLGYLCSMLDWKQEMDQLSSKAAMFYTAQVVRSALPASFVDMLLDILSGKSVNTEAKRSRSRYNMNRNQSMNSEPRNSSHRSDDMEMDLFDLALGGFNGETRRDNINNDESDEMDLGISSGASPSQSVAKTKDFLCESLLSESQHIQLVTLRLLSSLTAFDRRETQEEAVIVDSLGVGMDLDYVKSKMLQRVSIDQFDPASPLDVHILLTLMERLLTNHHHVSQADVKALLRAAKQAAKELQKDQQVCCSLVESLRFIVPHLKDVQDQARDSPPAEELGLCRDFFFKIISSFWQLACDGTSPLKLRMAELLLDLIKFDPDCSWGQLMVEGNADSSRNDSDSSDFSLWTVKTLFPRILLETSLQVRAFVAHSINWLFTSHTPLNKKSQLKIFDEVFMLSSELLNVEEGSTLFLKDELSSGQGIFLHVLLTIIKCSPVCEKHCLLGLLQMMTHRQISIQLVRKMLHQACSELGYSSVEQYLSPHLPYLVYNWLHTDMVNSPIVEFPFQLLGYKDIAAFTKAYPSLIISMLLATKLNLTEVQERLTHAGLDVHSTLLAALPDTLVHILPQFAVKAALDQPSSQTEGLASSQPNQHKQCQAANKCFAALKKVLSEQEINDRIYEMLGVIVVKVLSCLQIKSVSDCMVYPEPNPPYYTEDKIILTLDFLAQNFNEDNRQSQFSLASVLAKIPNGLQEVFLSLSSQLWQEHHAHEQNRCLHMMGIFVRLVLKELKPTGGGNNSVVSDSATRGIVRDILNRLLVILHSRVKNQAKPCVTSPSYEEDVVLSCLRILHDVCRSVIENCPHELVPFLHCIVDTVAHVAGMSETVGQKALQFLLFVTAQGLQELNSFPQTLQDVLFLLSPLPPVPVLVQLRPMLERRNNSRTKSLPQLLDDFLTVTEMTSSCPFQGLALRLKDLSSRILDTGIQDLMSSEKGLGKMRDVIQRLSSLCTSSSQDVAVAAASCLGFIGPVNLQVLSLKFHQSSRQDDDKAQVFEKYHWLFQALDACLLDESLEVVSTASKILQRVMTTESSKQFEKHYTRLTRGQGSLFRYLQPFKNSPLDVLEPDPLPSEDFSIMSRKELWLGEMGGSTDNINQTHEAWIKALVKALLSTGVVKDEILCKIGPLCALKGDFCESSLPYLIHEALIGGYKGCKEILSQQFTSFFTTHVAQQTNNQLVSSEKHALVINKRSIRAMLAVVQYLRTQKRPQQRSGEAATAWHNNLWLDLDYLAVAQAAQFCGASFSAVLYTEIYWGIKRQAQEHQQSQQSSSGSTRSSQSQRPASNFVSPEETAKCQRVLMEAYKTIGDPDGIYGCGAGKQENIMARVETYMHELQQEKALITLDIAMCNDPTLNMTHLLQVVQSCGADYILQQCLPQIQSQMGSSSSPSLGSMGQGKWGQFDEFYYQAAWKLGQWDICLSHGQERQSSLHESIYKCLHCIKDGHLDTGLDSLHSARLNALQCFDPMAETCSQLYPFLSQLQCLGCLEQALEGLKKYTSDSFTIDYQMRLCDTKDFHYQETLLQLMSATGRVLERRGSRHGETLEVKALWDLALGGRKAKHFQVAERAIQSLRLKHSTSGGSNRDLGFTLQQLQLEEAKLFWARSEVDMAKNILHNLIQAHKQQARSSQQTVDSETHLQSLVLYGNWVAETKSGTPSGIMDFFQTAVNSIKSKTDGPVSDKAALRAFVSLATYADEQYQLIVDYMQSPDYEEKCRLVRQSKSEVEEYQKLHVQNRITVQTIKKNFEIDEREVEGLQTDRDRFLLQALDGYLQCLERGSSHDLRISRVLALWFDNSAISTVNSMIEKYVPKLQSHKFLLLFYQLAARMGVHEGDSGFNSTLIKLLERIAVEHPHHSLWVVLALAHAHKDSEFTSGGNDQKRGRGRGSAGDPIAEEERVQAAKDLLERVSRTKSQRAGVHLDQIVDGMRQFSLACIQLANMPVDKKGGPSSYSIPSSQAIVKLQNLEHVQVPIVELAIDPTGSYPNLVSLVKFERTFRTAGGVNLPKIIGLECSDGVKRTSLVKGRDDLRQDAVMQQVFSQVNQLLAADQETRRRQLSIRTYKVIPLSQNSGLLQWCEGTMPVGEYLAARQNDAHSRYNPLDWKVNDCRKHLHDAGAHPDKRFKAYQEICDHFHPVFRHFFMEKYVRPEEWFERRLVYTRSVATNSIVGYILGLGDRHVNNILIDLKTAELVHIDFGIAFERGRILPTPETVPFRLTRDIVDGMGIPGVEGVFRRCCEKMMQVMKNNSEALLTIVQVLLHDPLSHWSLTPDEVLALERKREQAATDTVEVTLSGQVPSSGIVSQRGKPPSSNGDADHGNNNETKEKRNKVAERALLRLRQKLRGEEDTVPLSVSGQVNLLIQQATDPQNLCRLFVGWQAYL